MARYFSTIDLEIEDGTRQEKILKYFKMNIINNNDIRLDLDKHEYSLIDDSTISFTSVTTFVNSFFEPFDEEKVSNHLVNNVPKYYGETPASLIEKWNLARKHGTDVHLEIENWIKDGTSPKDQKSIAAKKWIEGYVARPNIKTFSEVIVYSKELRIAGTMDVLMLNKDSEEHVIIDWKTSRRIDKNSFKGKKGIKKETSDIEDCNYNHYALQLSLYRFLLEEYYNINVTRQLVAHLKDNGLESHSTPYMKKEILDMLGSIDKA